jgi:predicted ATPase
MCRSPIWREPMRTSSNSMMLGAALAKRRRRLKQKERWFEAELHRIAGEIALKSPQQDAEKAETYFEHSLAIARQQQAKSWELRAAISLARLWRDQGKVQQARELLAPAYGWFTEGFDTRDLKEAKALAAGVGVLKLR